MSCSGPTLLSNGYGAFQLVELYSSEEEDGGLLASAFLEVAIDYTVATVATVPPPAGGGDNSGNDGVTLTTMYGNYANENFERSSNKGDTGFYNLTDAVCGTTMRTGAGGDGNIIQGSYNVVLDITAEETKYVTTILTAIKNDKNNNDGGSSSSSKSLLCSAVDRIEIPGRDLL